MIRLETKNFRILRNVEFNDDRKISLVVGYNESGKSTLINAIKFAMTGEAYGHRGKNVSSLCTHGEDKLKVSVEVGGVVANRTTSIGTNLKDVAAALGVKTSVLPILFDAKMCSDGGNKHLKAFFEWSGENKFNPLLHFANDPSISECITKAIQSGRDTARSIISFCEDKRAASKPPEKPVRPGNNRPDEAQIKSVTERKEQAAAELSSAESALSEAKSWSNSLLQCATYLEKLRDYKEAEKKASESSDDPLATKRAALNKLKSVNLSTFDSYALILENAGYPDLSLEVTTLKDKIQKQVSNADRLLDSNPPPVAMPEYPRIDASAAKMWDELKAESEGNVTEALVNEFSTLAINQQEKLESDRDKASTAFNIANEMYNTVQQLIGAWSAFDTADHNYDVLASKTKNEWDKWHNAAHAISDAESEFIAKTGTSFAALVTSYSKTILQGRSVTIEKDKGIFLGATPVDELSESTKWRVEVAVLAAIATACGSPILLIDGADILDVHNRSAVTSFLVEQIAPNFDHIVLTLTCPGDINDERPLDSELFPTVSKWVVDAGQVRKL